MTILKRELLPPENKLSSFSKLKYKYWIKRITFYFLDLKSCTNISTFCFLVKKISAKERLIVKKINNDNENLRIFSQAKNLTEVWECLRLRCWELLQRAQIERREQKSKH